MKKLILTILLLCGLYTIYADGSQAFELDLKKDLIIGSAAIGAFTTGYLYKDHKELNDKPFNWIDKNISFPYNSSLDKVGDFLSLSTVATLPMLLDGWNLESISTVGVMYFESALLAFGIKDMLKGSISRPRPYIFRDDTSAEMLNERDGYFSFPSGHTTVAFMTASFSSYVFSKGESSDELKLLMGLSTFSLATTTAVLRVISGAHYPTDTISGAVLGSVIGFAVPYMHYKPSYSDDVNQKQNSDYTMAFVAIGTGVGIAACGINMLLPENIKLVYTGNTLGVALSM